MERYASEMDEKADRKMGRGETVLLTHFQHEVTIPGYIKRGREEDHVPGAWLVYHQDSAPRVQVVVLETCESDIAYLLAFLVEKRARS